MVMHLILNVRSTVFRVRWQEMHTNSFKRTRWKSPQLRLEIKISHPHAFISPTADPSKVLHPFILPLGGTRLAVSLNKWASLIVAFGNPGCSRHLQDVAQSGHFRVVTPTWLKPAILQLLRTGMGQNRPILERNVRQAAVPSKAADRQQAGKGQFWSWCSFGALQRTKAELVTLRTSRRRAEI
jgi:hypothetical protein